ncbi:MAG: carotenoid biosynthesis protein [Deinococcales bacterium]|nr:carotenoid biosynthesis protein [Chitinophagaceae bacterium]
MKKYLTKYNIAIFIALLFHISGAIGILFTPYKAWFIANTPLNLVIMLVLLIWLQPKKNVSFFLFFAITFLVGMGTEIIGVNTGKLFGHYHYGSAMGTKLNGVPFLIGINWFVVVFCSGIIITKLNNWIEDKYLIAELQMPPLLKTVSFIIDGALLATLFDYNLEPVAIKLNFWQWQNNQIPLYNFICWFLISAFLLLVFKRLNFSKSNQFAIHLFIIQSLFFIGLQIYL